jgi:hypothetical protein
MGRLVQAGGATAARGACGDGPRWEIGMTTGLSMTTSLLAWPGRG